MVAVNCGLSGLSGLSPTLDLTGRRLCTSYRKHTVTPGKSPSFQQHATTKH